MNAFIIVIISCLLPSCFCSIEAIDTNLKLSTDWQPVQFVQVTKTGHSRIKMFQIFDQSRLWEKLIKKGHEADEGKYPYMVSIQILWTDGLLYHICGGVLVSRDKVLTAAHCLIYWGKNDHFAALGVQNLSEGGEATISVTSVSIHPGFNGTTNDYPNDVAVLTLDEEATLTPKVQLAQLHESNIPAYEDWDNCTAIGWGKTEEDELPDGLRFTHLYAISNNVCRRFLRIFQYLGLQQYHRCAWRWPGAACQGDSGGPLLCNDTVVGLTSWGVRGCTGCYPGVYTRVSYHHNWIIRQ